jgi:chromosome partitioning protein
MPLSSKPTDDEFSILAPIDRVGKGAYLFLLPSELELARAVKNPQGVEFRLHKLLQRWERYFDYAFIDCAPTDTVLTATALMAANFVLVPMRPDRFSILGMAS